MYCRLGWEDVVRSGLSKACWREECDARDGGFDASARDGGGEGIYSREKFLTCMPPYEKNSQSKLLEPV